MNRNCYRLVFNTTLGMMVPVAETARRSGKAGGGKASTGSALALAGMLLAGSAQAELPVASANFAAPGTTASYQTVGTQAYLRQVGNKAIVNFQTGNISAGHDLQLSQVDNLVSKNLVHGAVFSILARVHDINPSIIAGSISQAAGQQANFTMVNSNGIAFMGSAQVNLSSFTASTLNIADSFIYDSFLTNSPGVPQFEKALDGSEAKGFIKVFEGAQITAGSFGRVMLIAPTVVNKGTVTAPDGQVIAAAGSKVYLRSAAGETGAYRNVNGLLVEVDSPSGLASYNTDNLSVKDGVLDGQAVDLTDAADDRLGHVTNLGELSTPRGNVTMIGYAVNQRGIARATTSVVANGSVYLLAEDTFVDGKATRGGQVTLGAGSKTEILPDAADATGALDGATGQGLAKPSRILALGQEIEMQGGATLTAPSGEVDFVALDNPGQLDTTNDPFKNASQPVSAQARVRIASGAVIDVSGLESVRVSAARNSVEVELRGDELKDSPANREGSLRGEKVYVDVNRALGNANAGKSTLIARDSLESYQAKLERTVAERSTAGGTVTVKSQGEALLESGATVNLSGGSVQYTAAQVKTTLLSANGKLVDLADADAETHYDGIATRYVKDYGRWNKKEVIDLGQSYRPDPGYTDGKDAGALNVIGMAAVQIQSAIQGGTITGELQREAGIQPKGAVLKLGSGSQSNDYKLNQKVLIGAATPGDVNTLALNTALFGRDKIANLEIFSNQAAEVREALRLPQGGSVAITAKGVAVNADVEAAAGKISFNARNSGVDAATVPLDVTVAAGVTLAARGDWANDLPAAPGRRVDEAALVSGGTVTLSAAGDVKLGADSMVDVTGGGRVKPDGKMQNGNGGNVTLEAGAGAAAGGSHTASVELGGEILGRALGKGGTFKLNTRQIQIGGAQDTAALNLGTDFFTGMGFAKFDLTGRDGVTVADSVTLAPRVTSLELQPGYALQPTGGRIETFSRSLVRDDRVREAANLTLTADSTDFGVMKLGGGAKIQADDRASVALNAGKRVEIRGEVTAAGGTIQARVSGDATQPYDATNTVWLGPQALLDVSGAARTYRDSTGLIQGEVLNAGSVSLEAVTGFVVTEAGSVIRASGAVPMHLDVRNEAGGIGRNIGSDAGAIKVAAREGALLDGALQALAGGAANRGGRFEFTLGNDLSPQGMGFPADARVLSVAPAAAVQAGGLVPGDAIPTAFNGQTKLSDQILENAGFDRIALKSRDVIRLENSLDLGGGRTLPLREITLDAPRLETAGGDASLAASTIRLGNYDAARQQGALAPVAGTGVFKANAELLELAGSQVLSGMAQAELTGSQEVRLAGISTDASPRPLATLRAAADLVIHGALVAPSTYSSYTIDAAGRAVNFTRNSNPPVQPLSALGGLTVIANDIVQDGNLWAPLGQIDFQASNSLVFKDGSLTSVSAAPGSLIPFGKVENGRNWVFKAGAISIAVEDMPEKSIRTQAASIDMQPGAKFDISGGGDVQGYEFTVGPGGSRDILADKNTYAILPGNKGGFAPGDAQEGFDRASGEAVYLSGVPGLADGVYTLLPAHYALLPGAYAVKLDSGIKNVMPGQAYSRQDGVRIAAGYVTDSRALSNPGNAPKDAGWQGVQVMTHNQVRARSEFTLTRASQFFAGSSNRAQDAGLLSISTSGSGANALRLDALYNLAAGYGGHGSKVDISAQNLAITSGSPAGIDPAAVMLDVDKLNAMGADSLLLGATRSGSDSRTLDVGADKVTLANDASHALKAGEIMLAAKDTLTLKAGSAVDAQGAAGDAGTYTAAGNGAFVRAASTTAQFTRSGNPDRMQGTLAGEAGSALIAADSVTLDATKNNAYKGAVKFEKEQAGTSRVDVAGNLGVGATRVNFGAANGAEGMTYSQAELDALALKALTLTSYSTFDLYGDVRVGQIDANGKPVMQNLTLQGAGLAGIANAGQTAQINARNLTLANPDASAFAAGGVLGSGNLTVTADTLTLASGDKAIKGFSAVAVTANELAGTGTGKLDVAAPVTLNVARISGKRGANQALQSTGALVVANRIADRILAPVTALGAKWALAGTSVDFNSHVELPSGSVKLTAGGGHVKLGANARVDVSGRAVQFFDVTQPSWGGAAEFVSETDNVEFAAGSNVDVSAAAGGDAGTLIVRAANGTFTLADGSVSGATPVDSSGTRGDGARADIDSGTLASFSTLNSALNSGGFGGARALRVRSGDVSIAASDTVKAHAIELAADGGKLDVAGGLDASGEDAGRIELFAKNDVNVLATARLKAQSGGTNKDGGDIEIGTTEGSLNLVSGSSINVAGGPGALGGTVLLRAPRTSGDTDVAVTTVGSAISGARSVAVEAVKLYSGVSTLTDKGASSGTILSLDTVKTGNAAFAGNYTAIKARLETPGNPAIRILSGVDVLSTGDLTLANDWNLSTARAGGEAGALTLRAKGNLLINNNLSDGFNVATPLSGTTPATLLTDDSWSYRLVAGADSLAANPLAVTRNTSGGNLNLAAGKLIRTGTGDIRLAAGGNIEFKDNKSAIYTAGKVDTAADAAAALAGFTHLLNAQFSQHGGDVIMRALGDIASAKRSEQLYSNWLFRQGKLNADGSAYTTLPAWWVRFDQFQQGVATLGGGDVTIMAGGKTENLSASAATQARMASTTPDANALVKTGGGTVRVETGGDVLGGQVYADNGELVIKAGGKLDTGDKVSNKPLHTILALGDAQAKVQAREEVNIHAILNPHLVIQSSGSGANVNIGNANSALWSLFSTYGENSAAFLSSLGGAVSFHNAPTGSGALASMTSSTGAYKSPLNTISSTKYSASKALGLLPGRLGLVSFQNDVLLGGASTLRPSTSGGLSALAAGSVSLPGSVNVSDMAAMPDAVLPGATTDSFAATTLTAHAVQPVHAGDAEPVRVYAVAGDVAGATNKLNLTSAKAVWVKAGQDVKDLGLSIQHPNVNDISQVEAGRDVTFTTGSGRSDNARIWIGGPGRLEVTAGRDIDLGASAGIVSRGELDNVALPTGGSDIHVAAGVGANGIDYAGAVDRLIARLEAGAPDAADLWLARWLTGDDTLAVDQALTAVRAVDMLSADSQREQVRKMVFTALRVTGRDSNSPDSPYAADYARGYAALETVFPGIGEKLPDGSFKHYQGGVDLFASRILTTRGGDIEIVVPGGSMIVGLSNTPNDLVGNKDKNGEKINQSMVDGGVLGIALSESGDIRGFGRDDILVNQSRILTVGGGDVLLWSSEGDIDAGKGKKTAAVVPPPLILVNSQGNVTQVLQGAATGSGIAALQPAGGIAGDVDLIAPKGTVNAGDAGIRAGNLNIAAQVVLGADNISVSGSSAGTPVADTSAVTAASSGASSADGGVGDATAALSGNLAEAARAAEELKKSFKPTFITAEVVGHGE